MMSYQNWLLLLVASCLAGGSSAEAEPRKFIVTGAAGYIGSHVAWQLLEWCHEVVLVDDMSRGSMRHLELLLEAKKPSTASCFGAATAEFVDLGDERAVRDLLKRHNDSAGVAHLAAVAFVQESTDDPELYKKNITNVTKTLAEAVVAAGIEVFVQASSYAVYGSVEDDDDGIFDERTTVRKPQSPYGQAKADAEDVLYELSTNTAMQTTILRFANVVGARSDAGIGQVHLPELDKYRRLWTACAEVALGFDDHIELRGPDDFRDYVHVQDVARAVALAAVSSRRGSGGFYEVLNVASQTPVRAIDFVDECQKATGRDIRLVVHKHQSGESTGAVGNNSAIRASLDWVPQKSLSEAVADAWAISKHWPSERQREMDLAKVKIAVIISGKLRRLTWRGEQPILSRNFLLSDTAVIDVYAAFEVHDEAAAVDKLNGLNGGRGMSYTLYTQDNLSNVDAAIAACGLDSGSCDILDQNLFQSASSTTHLSQATDSLVDIASNVFGVRAARSVVSAWIAYRRQCFLRTSAWNLVKSPYDYYVYAATDHVPVLSRPTPAVRALYDRVHPDAPTILYDKVQGLSVVVGNDQGARHLFENVYSNHSMVDFLPVNCALHVESVVHRCAFDFASDLSFRNTEDNSKLQAVEYLRKVPDSDYDHTPTPPLRKVTISQTGLERSWPYGE